MFPHLLALIFQVTSTTNNIIKLGISRKYSYWAIELCSVQLVVS